MNPIRLPIKGLYLPLLLATVFLSTSAAFDLNSSSLSIAENQSAGTVVGEINASASNGNFTFNVAAHTSQANSADTPGAIGISFLVNGAWTANETFFSSATDFRLTIPIPYHFLSAPAAAASPFYPESDLHPFSFFSVQSGSSRCQADVCTQGGVRWCDAQSVLQKECSRYSKAPRIVSCGQSLARVPLGPAFSAPVRRI